MKIKPLLILAGAAGVVATILKRREAARAVSNVVDAVTPGGGDQPQQRYQPPAEGLAQEPTTPGGPPSSAAHVVDAPPIESEPGFGLNEPEHDPPEGAVMPDTSDDDPLVRQQENAAAGDAGSIGGNVDELAADDESVQRDPADRPVAEGSGEEFETFESREDTERGNREREP